MLVTFLSFSKGKSTLAKYLYNISLDSEKQNNNFDYCSQTGYDGYNYQILVYDEKFIERNFINKDIQKCNCEADLNIIEKYKSNLNEIENNWVGGEFTIENFNLVFSPSIISKT